MTLSRDAKKTIGFTKKNYQFWCELIVLLLYALGYMLLCCHRDNTKNTASIFWIMLHTSLVRMANW